MPKLPRISGAEAVRALEKLGFVKARQAGSHVVLKKQTNQKTIGCVVPLHQELKVGTLSGLLKQAQVSVDEFSKICEIEPGRHFQRLPDSFLKPANYRC